MKTFKVSKMFAAIIAGFLVLFATVLMIFASNFAMSSYYDIPINPLIMALFSFFAIAVAVWLVLKIFAYSKKGSALFFAACLLTGIASESYGIYSDKISTGVFGIFGTLLIITALVFGVFSLYRSKKQSYVRCYRSGIWSGRSFFDGWCFYSFDQGKHYKIGMDFACISYLYSFDSSHERRKAPAFQIGQSLESCYTAFGCCRVDILQRRFQLGFNVYL